MFYEVFIRLSQGCCKDAICLVTKILQGFYEAFTRCLQGCYNMLQGCSQGFHKVVTKCLQSC